MQGGGWCNTIASCSYRKTTALGSSKYMDRQVKFAGILSSDPYENPGKYSFRVGNTLNRKTECQKSLGINVPMLDYTMICR